jgi:VanZ family protein
MPSTTYRPSMHALRFSGLWVALGILLVAAVWWLSLTGNPPQMGPAGSDKAGHMLAYLAQTLWFAWLFPRRRHLLVAALFIAQGVLLEALQWAGGVRSLEGADMLANGAGAAMAFMLAGTRLRGLLQRLDRRLAGPPPFR